MIGLQRFLTTTHLTTGAAFTASLVVAKYVSQKIDNLPILATVSLGGFSLALAGIAGLHSIKPKKEVTEEAGEIIHSTVNPAERLASFSALTIGNGLIISPLFLKYEFNPNIINSAIVASVSTFIGSAFYASTTQERGEILKLKIPLMGSLTSLLFLQSASIFTLAFYGPNEFTNLCCNIDVYGGILLFTGFVAYDTAEAINDYETKQQADHLYHSTGLFLDVCNLFVRFIPIMVKYYKTKDRKKDEKKD